MFVAWYSSEFWRHNLDDVPCTVEEMELAADGAFVIGFFFRNPVIERGIAGLTGKNKNWVTLNHYSTADLQWLEY